MLLLLLAGIAAAMLIAGKSLVATKGLGSRASDEAAFRRLHEALTNYVMLNKRLPCPANATSAGMEDPGDTCPTPAGPVPWATLGFQQSAAIDSYGRLYGYRVLDGTLGFTKSNAFPFTDCLEQSDTNTFALSSDQCNATTHENTPADYVAPKGLTVDNGQGTSVGQVAYVLMSHGPTGYGAYLPDSAGTMPMPTEGSKEKINASGSSTYWALEPSRDLAATDVNHFDDVLSYRKSNDLVLAARLRGNPWQFAARLDASNLGIGLNNNLGSSTGKASATTGNAMTITAAGDTTRYICVVSSTPSGIAPCTTTNVTGLDKLTTSGNEKLTFEFRFKRRYLKVKFSDFFQAGSNIERARLTFFNGATQVYEVVKSGCENPANPTARFRIDPGAEFNKVEIRADDSSIASAIAVSSISACKSSTTSNAAFEAECFLREADGKECP